MPSFHQHGARKVQKNHMEISKTRKEAVLKKKRISFAPARTLGASSTQHDALLPELWRRRRRRRRARNMAGSCSHINATSHTHPHHTHTRAAGRVHTPIPASPITTRSAAGRNVRLVRGIIGWRHPEPAGRTLRHQPAPPRARTGHGLGLARPARERIYKRRCSAHPRLPFLLAPARSRLVQARDRASLAYDDLLHAKKKRRGRLGSGDGNAIGWFTGV